MSAFLSIEDLLVRHNSVYAIPINISDADRLMAFSLTIRYDSTVFSSPSFGDLITTGSLTTELSLTVNDSVLGLVTISGSGVEPLDAGKGSLATLNLQVRTDATLGSTQIQLISASLNEDNIAASLSNPEIIVLSELKSIESTNSIKYRKNVSTYNLENPVITEDITFNTIIVGTKKKDTITGSSQGEILTGFKGKDILIGGGGADGFLFTGSNSQIDFGLKKAYKIKDFKPDEGDSMLIEKELFGNRKSISFKAVSGKEQTKKAMQRTSKLFVYDDIRGRLYLNENGRNKGWGDGGLFAVLEGAPELGVDNFTIV